MKTCNKCGYIGELDCFVMSKAYKDGHRPLCLGCKRAQNFLERERRRNHIFNKSKQQIYRERTFPSAVELLVNKGYCFTEEEAKEYVKHCRVLK